MEKLGLNDIREKFLQFFESKQHLRLASSSLIPNNDKSLLLINSGMAPLKPYFTGQEAPPSKRVVTCQKCIRTGDIDNVGVTARHGTFFEMLGNFSFGDYFKEEIIPWSWEFVTEVMKLPIDRLYVSVYLDDDEAYDIWHKKVGLPEGRIVRMGKEDNFWEVGLGPCGPCSEIYFDRGEGFGCGKPSCEMGCDCDRYMEFWNLVFTQFSKEEDGSYKNLQHPNIDTGMGLERMAIIMQGAESFFDVDTMKAIRNKVCEIAGCNYNENPKQDISIRVITDHVRSVTFMAADGVLPSNVGRGYVFRRLLRRAARHGKLLNINSGFLSQVCEAVINVSKTAYPELEEKKEYILKVLSVEEQRFFDTLEKGLVLIKKLVADAHEKTTNIISGQDAFKLYDTYGFPLELMKEIFIEENLGLDEPAFNAEMEKQRKLASSSAEETTYMGADDTIYNNLDVNLKSVFVGYSSMVLSGAQIYYIVKGDDIVSSANAGDQISIIFDKTVFYAESGGQKGDIGLIKTPGATISVSDTIKVGGNKIAHIGVVTEGSININDKCTLEPDRDARLNTARNHSATHILHKALKTVLGNHVQQAGSMVSRERLRFDFTHFEPVSSQDIIKIEDIVNQQILNCLDIQVFEKDINEAKKMGAEALFGEKYGSVVRVVEIGNFSTELCGGTHLKNSSQIFSFKILSETGISAGVRRIEAITGQNAYLFYKGLNGKMDSIAGLLKTNQENVANKIEQLITNTKALQKQIDSFNSKLMANSIDEIVESKLTINDLNVIAKELNDMDINSLKAFGDQLKSKLPNSAIILASFKNEKVNLVVMASDGAVKQNIHAGNIIKAIAPIVGGSGGGKPAFAQAGGKDKSKIGDALNKAIEIIRG
ncbi:MAG: alanine--tRNA ligase [Clostridiales bacterium]|jgi:alanyl-tRNA synthetase|nr:alanine--tRNA ligase [Clostridiales bacterium]